MIEPHAYGLFPYSRSDYKQTHCVQTWFQADMCSFDTFWSSKYLIKANLWFGIAANFWSGEGCETGRGWSLACSRGQGLVKQRRAQISGTPSSDFLPICICTYSIHSHVFFAHPKERLGSFVFVSVTCGGIKMRTSSALSPLHTSEFSLIFVQSSADQPPSILQANLKGSQGICIQPKCMPTNSCMTTPDEPYGITHHFSSSRRIVICRNKQVPESIQGWFNFIRRKVWIFPKTCHESCVTNLPLHSSRHSCLDQSLGYAQFRWHVCMSWLLSACRSHGQNRHARPRDMCCHEAWSTAWKVRQCSMFVCMSCVWLHSSSSVSCVRFASTALYHFRAFEQQVTYREYLLCEDTQTHVN
jgi:hypothetical protein